MIPHPAGKISDDDLKAAVNWILAQGFLLGRPLPLATQHARTMPGGNAALATG
jgi:hypothetical protein